MERCSGYFLKSSIPLSKLSVIPTGGLEGECGCKGKREREREREGERDELRTSISFYHTYFILGEKL